MPQHTSEPGERSDASTLCSWAARGDLAALQRALADGDDLTLGDYDGRTPLHLAAAGGHEAVVRFLLEDAKVTVLRDRFGWWPTDDAKRGGHEAVYRYLRTATAPAAPDNDSFFIDASAEVCTEDRTGRFVRSNRRLGSGSTKTVYLARDEEEGVDVAWNELVLDHAAASTVGRFMNEIRLLEGLQHPNILRCLTHFQEATRLIFITENMPGGSLKSFIHRSRSHRLKLKVTQRIGAQLLEALQYLHAQDPPVIHSDLQCDNIFVDPRTGDIKLGDFGLSGRLGSVVPVGHTLEFMPPEAMVPGGLYTAKGDVYSLGLCILEMVSGQFPYLECKGDPEEIQRRVLSRILPLALDSIPADEYRVPSLETAGGADIRDLVLACLLPEAERPSSAALAAHPIIAAYNARSPSPISTHRYAVDIASNPSLESLPFMVSPLVDPGPTFPRVPSSHDSVLDYVRPAPEVHSDGDDVVSGRCPTGHPAGAAHWGAPEELSGFESDATLKCPSFCSTTPVDAGAEGFHGGESHDSDTLRRVLGHDAHPKGPYDPPADWSPAQQEAAVRRLLEEESKILELLQHLESDFSDRVARRRVQFQRLEAELTRHGVGLPHPKPASLR